MLAHRFHSSYVHLNLDSSWRHKFFLAQLSPLKVIRHRVSHHESGSFRHDSVSAFEDRNRSGITTFLTGSVMDHHGDCRQSPQEYPAFRREET